MSLASTLRLPLISPWPPSLRSKCFWSKDSDVAPVASASSGSSKSTCTSTQSYTKLHERPSRKVWKLEWEKMSKDSDPGSEQKDIDASEESEGPLGHAVPERMQVGHHKLHKREVQDDLDKHLRHFDHLALFHLFHLFLFSVFVPFVNHVTVNTVSHVSRCLLELCLSLCLSRVCKPWPLPATVARRLSPLPIDAKQNLQILQITNLKIWNK